MYQIPHPITRCGVVSGVGRTTRLVSFLARWVPWIMLPMTKNTFNTEEKAKRLLERASSRWVEPDRKALEGSDTLQIMAASLAESVRQGAKGAAYNGMLIGQRTWGFTFSNIDASKIQVWHGALDSQVKEAEMRELIKQFTGAKVTFYPNEGQISIIVNHGKEILETSLRAMANGRQDCQRIRCPNGDLL